LQHAKTTLRQNTRESVRIEASALNLRDQKLRGRS
jgi:hypothetical protein